MIQSLFYSKSWPVARFAIFLYLFFFASAKCPRAFGQSEKPPAENRDAAPQPIDTTPAATVNGFTISKNQIYRELREANAGQNDLPPLMVANALRHLIRKQVVLAELQKGPEAIGPSELIMEIGKIETRLAETGTSLVEHVVAVGATRAEFDNELQWRTVWQRTLDAKLNDQTIEAYFELHHSDFDGTQLNVDQVLWVFGTEDPPKQRVKMRDQANLVYQRLTSGELEWSEAVREFSMSPLAKQPDRKSERWIGRRGPMPKPFTDAAFALKAGEFSQPIDSATGLHIIKCIEIQPGDRKLGEVVTEVRSAMAEEVFDGIADKAMPSQKIEYSGLVPYLGPDGNLVEPDRK